MTCYGINFLTKNRQKSIDKNSTKSFKITENWQKSSKSVKKFKTNIKSPQIGKKRLKGKYWQK
jgi:hypothetical protein